MRATTITLLPTTTFGTPSGTYDGSSTDWPGQAFPAADYYGGFGGLQTVAFFLTGFTGSVIIEATLDSDPSTAAWVPVYSIDALDKPASLAQSVNINGKFTWIRAVVEQFAAGSIDKVTVAY